MLSDGQLAENSEEYQNVKNFLQACLLKQTDLVMNKVEIFTINNADFATRFERRSGRMIKVACWTNVQTLGAENDLQGVCAKGFTLKKSTNGMEFVTGNLTLPVGEEGHEQILIYSDVAVGRAKVVEDEPAVLAEPLPAGFDSYYVMPKKLDRDGDGEFSLFEFQEAATFDGRAPSEYRHRYFIKDALQVLPRCIVRFGVGNAAKQSVPVTLVDEQESLEFFDPTSHRAVSVREKNASASGARQLVTIEAAYEQALLDYKQADPLLEGKKAWLEKQLDICEERVCQVNMNYAEVLEQLEQAAERATEALQEQTKLKLEALLGVEIELRREKEQVDWMDGVIKAQAKKTAAKVSDSSSSFNDSTQSRLDFLRSWKFHTVFRNAASRLKPTEYVQALSKVQADLVIKADMGVFVDANLASRKALQQAPTSVIGETNSAGEFTDNFLRSHLRKSVSQGHFAAPARPNEQLVSPTLQGIVDMEARGIQEALVAATQDDTLPLPGSISRPSAGGERYAMPLLAILNGEGNLQPPSNADHRQLFDDNISSFMGKPPAAATRGFQSSSSQSPSKASQMQQQQQTTNAATNRMSMSMQLADQKSIATQSLQNQQQASLAAASSSNRYTSPRVTSTSAAASLVPTLTNPSNGQPVAMVTTTMISPAAAAGAGAGYFSSDAFAADRAIMSAPALEKVAQRFPACSLKATSEKRRQQLKSRGSSQTQLLEQGVASLAASELVTPSEADTLYYCLPFFSKPPVCQLLYSSSEHRKGLSELYARCAQHKGPTVMLVQADSFVFGAYLTHPLRVSGAWSGGPACFLFSITLDTKLAFHGRSPPPDATGTAPVAFLADLHFLAIGNNDLVISEDLSTGTCSLEASYGVGMTAQSQEAACFLAGSSDFDIDDIEVWSLVF